MGTHPPNRDIFSKISQVSLMPSMRWTQRQTDFSPPDGMKYTIIPPYMRNGLFHAAPCASLRGKIGLRPRRTINSSAKTDSYADNTKKKRSSTQKVKRRNWLAGCELPFPAGEANESDRISVEV